jgi:hypothetical protein
MQQIYGLTHLFLLLLLPQLRACGGFFISCHGGQLELLLDELLVDRLDQIVRVHSCQLI